MSDSGRFCSQFANILKNEKGTPPGPPKPMSVLPKERTIADKFVDYLVGDGPSNRYALICKVCRSHNGMALKEDFEFTTFRCCYCYHLNEAKKHRPSAPPLERFSTATESRNSDSTKDTTLDATSTEEPFGKSKNIDKTKEGKESRNSDSTKDTTLDATSTEEPFEKSKNIDKTKEDESAKTSPGPCSEDKELENVPMVKENL